MARVQTGPDTRPRTEDPATFGKVAVLMGGPSSEREVSLKSGQAVLAALRRQGVDAHGVDVGHDIVRVLERGGFDRAFIALHGRFGEDGVIQGALEALGIPYTGSRVLGSALAMDKRRSKLLWRGAGIPTPAFEMLQADCDFEAVAARLGLPIFVKPAREGSSVGVTKVTHVQALRPAYEAAARYDAEVIAERAVTGGAELTAAILGDEDLPLIRLETATEFYDYEAKYLRADTRYHCPSGLPPAVERRIQQLARAAFETLGCSGWGRVDIMLDGEGEAFVLEVNTVPGMTDHSLVPKAAAQAGIGFDELVWRILETSLEHR
jgi:D-alanine-D-alanine ligase